MAIKFTCDIWLPYQHWQWYATNNWKGGSFALQMIDRRLNNMFQRLWLSTWHAKHKPPPTNIGIFGLDSWNQNSWSNEFWCFKLPTDKIDCTTMNFRTRNDKVSALSPSFLLLMGIGNQISSFLVVPPSTCQWTTMFRNMVNHHHLENCHFFC